MVVSTTNGRVCALRSQRAHLTLTANEGGPEMLPFDAARCGPKNSAQFL